MKETYAKLSIRTFYGITHVNNDDVTAEDSPAIAASADFFSCK
eukprot:SAG31_NODE_7977_length_1550_cov_1.508615_3_plen_42_part_01